VGRLAYGPPGMLSESDSGAQGKKTSATERREAARAMYI